MTPLDIAHFTAIALPPIELVSMAGRIGYASVGLRLFPAAPGAPLYAVPRGSFAAQSLHEAMRRTGVAAHDLEFVMIGPEFDAEALAPVLDATSAFGAKRVSCCAADPERTRLVASLGQRRPAAARPPRRAASPCRSRCRWTTGAGHLRRHAAAPGVP